jgi:AraC family transcriptional regulator of arabinose operon
MLSRPDSPLPPAGLLATGLFRMKKSYARWRERGAPGWLLVYTLGGLGRFGHRGGDLRVGTGDLVLLLPKIPNDYGLEEKLRRWNLLWAYFFPPTSWHPLLKWPEVATGLLRLHLPKGAARIRMVRQLTETHRLNLGSQRHREMFAMNSLEKFLLLCDRINPHSEQSRLDPRILQAMDYLCQNLSRPVPIALLARTSGLSISRLAHLFRQQVGQTPHQFLEMQRMAQARQLLELTQESVTAVAAQVGFPDLFHFSRRFRNHFGLSPRNYRRNLLGADAR